MRIANAFELNLLVLEHEAAERWASGIPSLDTALAGGLPYGRVHEIYAAQADDVSAAAGFVIALAAGMGRDRTTLWLRSHRCVERGGSLQANGWMELGGISASLILGVVTDTMVLLRTAADALSSGALGAVIVEGWGHMRELDLTASRRLALAAEKSGVPLLLLRVDAEPAPSAAQTRWQVASAPSHALPGHAPGQPTFDIELLRQRSGPSGLRWRLEWDRDQRIFREAALSGAVVPVPARQQAADGEREPLHHNRQYAA